MRGQGTLAIHRVIVPHEGLGARTLPGVRLGGPGARVRERRRVEVSGTHLRSEADATWLGLKGEHASGDGRWSFARGMHYATTSGGGYELGGGLSLGVRF